jgi:hypothetical protein
MLPTTAVARLCRNVNSNSITSSFTCAGVGAAVHHNHHCHRPLSSRAVPTTTPSTLPKSSTLAPPNCNNSITHHGIYDVAVIGGGIIGLACAREFQRRHSHLPVKMIVIEKESQLATHQSHRNSGVIHAGIHFIFIITTHIHLNTHPMNE